MKNIYLSDNFLDNTHYFFDENNYKIIFTFNDFKTSVSNLKNFILNNDIDYKKKYFYNTWDIVNLVKEDMIFLPKDVNLFINQSCFIWCNFCDKNLDKSKEKLFLWLEQIKSFFSEYPISDNINVNILWNWDPIYNKELIGILKYLKLELWVNITFFSWWKSLLISDIIYELFKYIDCFKINLSASNYKVYNKMHSNKITELDFEKLKNIIKKISKYSYVDILTVIMRDNILDLYDFYLMCLDLDIKWIEIKKNHHKVYDDNILNIPSNIIRLNKIVKFFSSHKRLNIISDIWSNLNNTIYFSDFLNKSTTILDKYISYKNTDINFSNYNEKRCSQFGLSIDLVENWDISLCCHYEAWLIWNVNNWWVDKRKYIIKKEDYLNGKTLDICSGCSMSVDRYKNLLKYDILNNL